MGAAKSALDVGHPGLLHMEAQASRKDINRNRRRRKKARPTTYVRREDRVRSILETLTPYHWPSIRPDWLKNPETNRNMELDCFCAELETAFEVDGAQHRRYIRHFHKSETFDAQRQRDLLKEALCRARKITLVRVPPREQLGDAHLVLWVMKALAGAGYNVEE